MLRRNLLRSAALVIALAAMPTAIVQRPARAGMTFPIPVLVTTCFNVGGTNGCLPSGSTYNPPNGALYFDVYLIPGAPSGASGGYQTLGSTMSGGAGGSGGACKEATFSAAQLLAAGPVAAIVGAGGARVNPPTNSGSPVAGNPSNPGNPTLFGSLLEAWPGGESSGGGLNLGAASGGTGGKRGGGGNSSGNTAGSAGLLGGVAGTNSGPGASSSDTFLGGAGGYSPNGAGSYPGGDATCEAGAGAGAGISASGAASGAASGVNAITGAQTAADASGVDSWQLAQGGIVGGTPGGGGDSSVTNGVAAKNGGDGERGGPGGGGGSTFVANSAPAGWGGAGGDGLVVVVARGYN